MRVINKTRTGIDNFKSTPSNRYVSLDFNDVDSGRLVRGIEIAMPHDSTDLELDLGRQYCKELQEFFRFYAGIDAPIRGDQGVKLGVGHAGVIHTEPFFAEDFECRAAIMDNAMAYAQLIKSTLGQIPNVTMILPHRKHGPGAVSSDGFSERGFARYILIPQLQKIETTTEPLVHAADTRPSVTFTESVRT